MIVPAICLALGAIVAPRPPGAAPRADTTLESLLAELGDPRSTCEAPAPGVAARLFSSFDRRAARADKDWFADRDAGNFLRSESHQGRREWVLADAPGPGAVVRVVVAPAQGRLRAYLDDAAEPALDLDLAAVDPAHPSPLLLRAGARIVCEIPIPYARRCVVTCDRPEDLEYGVQVRSFPRDTPVVSLAPGALGRPEAVAALALAEKRRAGAERGEPFAERSFEGVLSPSNPGAPVDVLSLTLGPEGPAEGRAIGEIRLQVQRLDPSGPALEQVLRHLVVSLVFDGEHAIETPLGDLFACGPPDIVHASTRSNAAADGTLTLRLWMPYRESAALSIRQTGKERVLLTGKLSLFPYAWTERTLHLHAHWRCDPEYPARPPSDWNEVSASGEGWLIGDVLVVGNPVHARWTGCDEKIWIDGEGFPSFFGTSAESYFGLAPGAAGDGSGYALMRRWRFGDAIPFQKSLRLDREVLVDADANLSLAATTFFYARPGAAAASPVAELAARGVPALVARDFHVDDALEAEGFAVRKASEGLAVAPADADRARVSGGRELVAAADAPGKFVELEIPVAQAGPREVLVWLARGKERGILRFAVDGKASSAELDAFVPGDPGAPAPLSLGVFELAPPAAVLRVEVAGTNERSQAPHYAFGIDCVVLKAPGS